MLKKNTMVRISKEHQEKLKKMATSENRSQTNWLQRMIDDAWTAPSIHDSVK